MPFGRTGGWSENASVYIVLYLDDKNRENMGEILSGYRAVGEWWGVVKKGRKRGRKATDIVRDECYFFPYRENPR